MGRRPPRRRLRALALLAALLLAFPACSAAPQPSATLAERLNQALRAGRPEAFSSNFTDPVTARRWFTALSPATASFSQPEPAGLEVRQRLPGDRREGSWRLHLELDQATGRISRLAPTAGRPIWTLGEVELTSTRSGTLLSSGLTGAARSGWADRLDRAAATVAAEAPPGSKAWTAGLVVELPAGTAEFQAITGESAAGASAITTCLAGTPRIVVNPAIRDQPVEWLDGTLVHEAVHFATDSACVAPGDSLPWAVEGLAESVTARHDPATAARNRELVLDHLRDHPLPKALPVELDDLTAYALAQLAVDTVRKELGAEADDLLDRAIHRSGSITTAELRRVTGWYLSALRRTQATR